MQGEYLHDTCGWSFETFRNPRMWTPEATQRPDRSLQAAVLIIATLAVLAWLVAQLIG